MNGCQQIKVGGPNETGSIHRIWTERKNPHKVVKLKLYWFYRWKHMTRTTLPKQCQRKTLLQDTKMLSYPLDRNHPSLRARGITLFFFFFLISRSLLVMLYFNLSSSRDTQFSASLFHSQVDTLTNKGKTDSQQDICHLHKLFSFF